MSAEIILEEVQGFVKKGVQFFFKIFCAIILLACIGLIFFKKENSAQTFFALFILITIVGSIVYLLTRARLITRISTDGIYVRFSPFHRTFRKFSWESIDEVYVRVYEPVREYGGWGIRRGISGKAFNISGNTGIQLVLKDGTRLLIGTNMPEEMKKILTKLGQNRFRGSFNK